MPLMVETFTTRITCERSLAKPVIGAVLQAILFQRAFGTVTPGTKDVLGLSLPCVVGSPQLDTIVDAKVDEIYRAIEHQTASSTNRSRQATAIVSFCQEQWKRTWYSKTVEEVPWEEYFVTIEMLSGQTERERNKIDSVTKQQLSDFLMALVIFADSHKAHAPPITNNDVLPFPIKIALAS